jgi:hypothetical protein
MADNELRQRKGEPPAAEAQPAQIEKTKTKKTKGAVDEEESSWKLDILRVLSFGLVASVALSHVISGGESMFWNLKNKPNYFRIDWWKAQLVRQDHGGR